MNLIILGPQGCGKGTQAELLVKQFNLAHLEMGAALREIAKEDSPLGRRVDETINHKKELVPEKVIDAVLEKWIGQIPAEQGTIIDGAPRKISQIDEVEGAFKKNNRQLDFVIFVNIPETESVLRISKRYSCLGCQARLILGWDFQNPTDPCPECGGKVEQRPDDTPQGVRKRLEIFRQETMPVIDHYRKQGKLLDINGMQSVEKVFQEILEKMNK